MKPCKDKGCLDYKYHKFFCNCECKLGKKMTAQQFHKKIVGRLERLNK